MALLFNTNIEKEVKDKIRGNVARIGGTVNQLVDFKSCKITDINILDGGYGVVKKIRNITSAKNFIETAKRYAKQKIKHLFHGEEICRDWRTILLDMHYAAEHEELRHKFDACITSNVIEHSPNPIRLLLNFYYVTKIGGYQFHAIPHYKYTFDMYRKPTPVGHLLEDFMNNTDFSDTTHNDDYYQSAVVKHGYFKKFHETNPVAYPLIHFHVFDEHNLRELLDLMFGEATSDILKTEAISDNVVIFKNKLNHNFLNRYKKQISEYSIR